MEGRKIFAWFLALTMVLTMLPTMAFAGEHNEGTPVEQTNGANNTGNADTTGADTADSVTDNAAKGKSVAATEKSTDVYSFTMPASNVTVAASLMQRFLTK